MDGVDLQMSRRAGHPVLSRLAILSEWPLPSRRCHLERSEGIRLRIT